MLLSIVSPVYNEEEAISYFLNVVREVAATFDFDYELVIVNDGSTDGTLQILRECKADFPQLRIINLVTNRGHMAALTAGYEYARGDYVVTIDADLQDPPSLIVDMMREALTHELDVVYAIRNDRTVDSKFKSKTASLYYWLLAKVSDVPLEHNAGDFRLLSRKVVDTLNQLPERQRVYRLLVPWLGYNSGVVEYKREERVAGKTHYPLSKMITLALDSITAFSTKPLRISSYLGLFFGFATMLAGISIFVLYLGGKTVPGWSSTMLTILGINSLQFLAVGVLGEYVAQIYVEAQRRPIYHAEELDRD